MIVPLRRKLDGTTAEGEKVLICSPLIALMHDQCERLNRINGIHAVYIGRDGDEEDFHNADYIFASPEILPVVGEEQWRTRLGELNISTIVIDEFHTIATWGEVEDTDRKAFRKWFSYIGELRSLHANASILALSATCTQKISKRVKKVLNLNSDTTEIRINPDRPNVKIVVDKISNSVDMAMAWIVEGLQDNTLPRTIIYCMSIKDASNIYMYIISEIRECKSVEMFHSETDEENKAKILEALKKPASDLTVVIATSALGMGIDIIDFHNVILYGSPKTIVDVIQEIGRAGRDGKPATALLLYNSFHLRASDAEVKELYKTKECRRKTLLAPFILSNELCVFDKSRKLHICCDVCYTKCNCQECSLSVIETLIHFIEDTDICDDTQSEDDLTDPDDNDILNLSTNDRNETSV